jgi:adenylate cyclase
MPGAEVMANAVATVLDRLPLRVARGWVNILLIVALGSAAPLASTRLAPLRALAGAVALGAVFTVAVQLAFDGGLILSFTYPLAALVLAALGTLAVIYLLEALERNRVRMLFARFVPGDVVDEVLARTDDNLRLGSVQRDCTVLFCDLRGFTTFSESQPAERVIEVVNFYLNEMTEAILDAGGTLISYLGDGLIALFGAPLEQPDHADRALTAAREMLGVRLPRLNTWALERGYAQPFRMGVGINSGPVMAGNVGSEQRLQYTVIGDTANTASRLEAMTKDSGHQLFLADSTRAMLTRPWRDLAFVSELAVRGRHAKVGVWSLGDGAAGSDGRGG